jgi:hypothetical protein
MVEPTVEMALHLSPVALLTLVFPLASARLDGVTVGGAGLTTLLLASSLTVPWLSQAVCLPVYRAIGALVPTGDLPGITRRFCEVWPTSFVQSTPLLVLFVVPVELTLHWSPLAVATYLALCLLHVAFAQSLVMANVARDRVRWAAAWAAYAGTLFALPQLWFLPPLAGLATQLWWMREELGTVRRPVWLDHRDVAHDLGRGLLLGSVLWADKLFLFLVTAGVFAVDNVFLALLPAILAYNYYFVRLAPGFDRTVEEVRVAMEHQPHHRLATESARLTGVVITALVRTGFVGAFLGLLVTVAVAVRTPDAVALVATVSLASWLFVMTTVVCYKLDYIGERSTAGLYSGAHLALCIGAFVVLPAGPVLYGWLIVLEAVLLIAAVRSCITHWTTAEYALFWRHATSW